jgi:hemerythrin-like domain-containing protein
MDILDILKVEHEKVLTGLDEIKNASIRTTGNRDKPWSNVVKDLLGHMFGEETAFYPALEGKHREMILEAIEEHKLVRTLMKEMDGLPKDDEVWTAKLKVMIENVRHHVQEEEGPIFRAARNDLGQEQLLDLGRRFEVAKEQAPR